jgi:hypothetical protein
MPVVTLSKDYRARNGAPVLRAVHTEIFSLRYFMRCMACNFCSDQCCTYGVDIDVGNVARLRALGPDFERFVGVPAKDWFTDTEVADAEFPSGAHVRTRTRDGACVFLSRAGRGCKIHAWCLEKSIDYHSLKPMVSILFPATFDFGVLGASSEVKDGSLVCAGEGSTVYDGVREEISYFFGAELVAELDRLRSNTLRA